MQTDLSVTGTATMDTVGLGSFRESPDETRPLRVLVVGETLKWLSVMQNFIDFKPFSFFPSVKTIQGETDKTYTREVTPTLQRYFNTVPRVNLVSDKIFKTIHPENTPTSKIENVRAQTVDNFLCSDADSDDENEVVSYQYSKAKILDSHAPEESCHTFMLQIPDTVVYNSDIKEDFELTKHLNSICENSKSQDKGISNKKMKVNAEEDNRNFTFQNDNYEIYKTNCTDSDDNDLDEIVKLKLKSNEYIRNDFDLMTSKRLLLFDPYGRPPRYEQSLNTGLLGELLTSFGMKFRISKYKTKKDRLDSKEIFCKNICLKDRKGAYYYIICNEDRNLDLKKTAKFLGAYRNLSFAPDGDVKRLLRVEEGGLNPFSLLYDHECKFRVAITTDLILESEKLFNFHPFHPHLTLCLSLDDLKKYLEIFNHSLEYLPL